MRFGARGDARDASANRQQCARTGSASPERESDIFAHYTLLFFYWFFDAVRGSMRPRRDAGRVWIVYFDVLVEKVRADDDKHLSVPSDCLR